MIWSAVSALLRALLAWLMPRRSADERAGRAEAQLDQSRRDVTAGERARQTEREIVRRQEEIRRDGTTVEVRPGTEIF